LPNFIVWGWHPLNVSGAAGSRPGCSAWVGTILIAHALDTIEVVEDEPERPYIGLRIGEAIQRILTFNGDALMMESCDVIQALKQGGTVDKQRNPDKEIAKSIKKMVAAGTLVQVGTKLGLPDRESGATD
jgi:hypothetical protein